MGIPRFFPRMREAGLASPAKEIGKEGSKYETLAIIDGPAFAHYIFTTLEAKRITDGVARSSIGTPVTYTQCAEEATRWLKQVERCGFEISSIFFDGALPAPKLPVRRQRLTRYAENLDIHRKLHARLFSGSTLGDTVQLKSKRRDLPPPPFLVSAVLEALVANEYSRGVFVVPGEADSFCVAAARKIANENPETPVTIFTNDSDLAVSDSGPDTRIALLNTIEWRTCDGGSVLLATECWPSMIAAKTQCKDLVPLAFYLYEERHISVRTASARIESGLMPNGPKYDSFAAQYDIESVKQTLATLQVDAAQRKRLQGLDARVAELVLQTKAPQASRADLVEFDMFLPFLLEDSERTCAWRIGTELRKLAYTVLLATSDHEEATINEYRRVGDRISPWVWKDWQIAALEDSLGALHDSMKEPGEKSLSWSSLSTWHDIVVQMMVREYRKHELHLPSSETVADILLGHPCYDWRSVQVAAHYQATYYSLRILLQVLRYQREDHSSKATYAGSAYCKLLGLLETLPSIADFFEPETEIDEGRKVWVKIVEQPMPEDGWQAVAEPHKKRRKRNQVQEAEVKENVTPPDATIDDIDEASSEDGGGEAGSLTGNRFAVLAG